MTTALSLFPQKIQVGEDVTEKVVAGERTQILQRAASLIKDEADASELEFHDASDDAVAVLIYVTTDVKGQEIQDEGIVLFADDDSYGVITGQYAEVDGVWLYPVPKRGLYVDNACVEYIRKKKLQEESHV
ncbi:hypothetical protein CcaCcLH18_07886 [Colletotrichum camelliae]|nr:hypothetical protein CcaCcLH18_07886 [Colletotrichum camelliae]